jgi:hypothetical protein
MCYIILVIQCHSNFRYSVTVTVMQCHSNLQDSGTVTYDSATVTVDTVSQLLLRSSAIVMYDSATVTVVMQCHSNL